jgi:Uma2 family endonuclease
MGATITHLMTFEEFEQLPETAGPFYYELQHGELVQVPIPKLKHYFMQSHLRKLLERIAGDAGLVEIEFGLRALPEFEFRIADVAFVSRERLAQIDPEGHFPGAPDLVIEVLSPSSTSSEMLDKEKVCLENGCREFWVVDIHRRLIRVSSPGGVFSIYGPGQEIPLRLFGTASLSVDAIFAA